MTTSANESLLILLVVLSTVLGAVLYVWTALALAGLFRKTDEEPWQGWVPVLNIAVVLRIAGFSPWLVLIGLFPVAGPLVVYVLLVISANRIGRGFGVGPGMTVLAALLFVVWASILGLGPARWRQERTADVAPPPWVFTPPLSETDPDDAQARSPRAPEPAAPPTLATPTLSARHFSPEPLAASGEAVAEREETPTGLQPSPWAPPSPFAPAAVPEPAADLSTPTTAPAAAVVPFAGDAAAVEPEPEPEPERDSPVASTEGAPVDEPQPDRRPAFSEPAPREAREPILREPAPAAETRPEPADVASESSDADDDGSDDARWPSEIDDVSAISPSPFPSRAASDRPGVVPSFADPDAASGLGAGRRTWDAVPATPIARRAFARTPDEFPELSDEVSAVASAPAAGAPRTAEAAVPAQLRRAEGPDDGDIDHTVVVARRRVYWQLVLPDGEIAPLTGDVAIVGRQPAPDPEYPRAQLVAIEDSTRTVSKTHARLELRSGLWHITDLHSTNGVVLTNFLGTEIELEPGSDAPAGERFLLGDAELRIERPGA
ncbi:FHA domain-containing protein [Microbacterium sp. AG238]|uniref:FHA domain-containing protein n=1 Tax=Microbacterium sp. AG238 TaxID=2183994 RepID=UPI000E7668A7|nr:FHA domain-containing protein [Microbacterium sp. AG238]RKE65041.1 FHA domain-containing protein [Microbacterium sp. AG238]